MTRSLRGLARRLAGLLFRHPATAWYLLVVALVVSGLALPHLRYRFGFKDSLRDDHPVRLAFDRYEEDFKLRSTLYAYFTGEGVYEPEFLSAAERLSGDLELMDEVHRVLSPVDLAVPAVSATGQVRMLRALRAPLRDHPATLRAALGREPFTGRWEGFLHDDELRVYAMVIQLRFRDDDPLRTTDLMGRLSARLARAARETDTRHHLSGLFFMNHEMLRVTFENQGRLTLTSLGLVLVLMTLMFGSPGFALATLALLGVSIFLALGAMALLGISVNGLSGNLPTMVIVIGLADIVHIAGRHSSGRRLYRPAGAALRALERTFVPNLFTSLTTFGCLMVMAWTQLAVLAQFAQALCLGVVVVYLVTIVYCPLLLPCTGIRAGRGLYFRIQEGLEASLSGAWARILARPRAVLAVFGLFGALSLGLSGLQRINSNWFRRFTAELPVSRSLDFLEAHGFPVTTVDLRIPSDLRADQLMEASEEERDVEELAAALRRVPGVLGVYSAFTVKGQVDAVWPTLEHPPQLAARWIEARRKNLYRQLVHGGAVEEYHSLATGDLRLVVTTDLEDSVALLALEERALEVARREASSRLEPERIETAGTMLYWSAIMDHVATTFFSSLLGALAVVALCFLLLTRSLGWTALALVPNVLPALAMFATAYLLGHDLSENFCLFVSLSIGIAVDDTLHLLYHVLACRRAGATMPAAVHRALAVVGAPITVTSLILMAGFSVCLAGTLVPTVLTGVFLNVSIAVALVCDLLLVPALLLAGSPPTPDLDRGSPGALDSPPPEAS